MPSPTRGPTRGPTCIVAQSRRHCAVPCRPSGPTGKTVTEEAAARPAGAPATRRRLPGPAKRIMEPILADSPSALTRWLLSPKGVHLRSPDHPCCGIRIPCPLLRQRDEECHRDPDPNWWPRGDSIKRLRLAGCCSVRPERCQWSPRLPLSRGATKSGCRRGCAGAWLGDACFSGWVQVGRKCCKDRRTPEPHTEKSSFTADARTGTSTLRSRSTKSCRGAGTAICAVHGGRTEEKG